MTISEQTLLPALGEGRPYLEDFQRTNRLIVPPEAIEFAREAMQDAREAFPQIQRDRGILLLIGSRAVGTASKESDADYLYISDDEDFSRSTATSYNGIDLSLSTVPTSMLRADMRKGRYGGFFAARLLGPYYFANEPSGHPDVIDTVIAAPAVFLWPFIEYDARRNRDIDAKTAPPESLSDLAIKAAMDYNPLYEGWFINYYGSHRYDQIRDAMRFRFALSLKAAGLGGGFEWLPHHTPPMETAPPINSDGEYARRLEKYSNRFWLSAYAARQNTTDSLENAMDFLDEFEGKSDANIASHGPVIYQSMRTSILKPKVKEYGGTLIRGFDMFLPDVEAVMDETDDPEQRLDEISLLMREAYDNLGGTGIIRAVQNRYDNLPAQIRQSLVQGSSKYPGMEKFAVALGSRGDRIVMQRYPAGAGGIHVENNHTHARDAISLGLAGGIIFEQHLPEEGVDIKIPTTHDLSDWTDHGRQMNQTQEVELVPGKIIKWPIGIIHRVRKITAQDGIDTYTLFYLGEAPEHGDFSVVYDDAVSKAEKILDYTRPDISQIDLSKLTG